MRIGRHARLAHDVLRAMCGCRRFGVEESTGFQIACGVAMRRNTRRLVGYGTLYLVLDLLERRGVLSGCWRAETSGDAPRRKYYSLVIKEVNHAEDD